MACLCASAQPVGNPLYLSLYEPQQAHERTADTGRIKAPQHSPKKATIMSAVLPGAGQVYNRKWWKVPIIYVGFGVSIYAIQHNNKIYKEYRTAYLARIDGDTNTQDTKFPGLADETVQAERDRFARYRDISWLCLIGIYALNVIDANVDAHLFAFDVDESLSLQWQPNISYSAMQGRLNAGAQVGLSWHIAGARKNRNSSTKYQTFINK